MSDNFHEDVLNLKSKIKEQCIIYQSNYQEFYNLITIIKEKKNFNVNDLKQCEQLITQMNNGEVRVIFCGQLKSGKSRCVMEFLSGAISLPSRDTPATTFFTKIFFSEPPILYSENCNGNKEYHDFDGKHVDDNLVGKRQNFLIDETNLDLIYHIGISDPFLKNGVIIIDSPGLNESQSLDDAFKRNLLKMNPQIVIYIFNYGPGFVDSDVLYYTTVIANLRKDLRKIFLFNKYDQAFNIPIKFPDQNESSTDDSEDESSGEYSEDEDDEEAQPKNFTELYNLEFDRHKRKLEETHCGSSCPCLIGYSGKCVELHRRKKDRVLAPLRAKHLDLLKHVRCNIISLDFDITEKILSFTNQFLFSEFKIIFSQILYSDNTNQFHNLLTGTNREKLLLRFDVSHEKLLNILVSQIPHVNFDGEINQIVKNHEKIPTTILKTKIHHIINSLTKFFIDRYVNYFSNVILSKLDEICFEKLNDELRQKDMEGLFSHTLCTLSFEAEKIESVIKLYFNIEAARLTSQNINIEGNNFHTTQGCTFYIKSKFKYQKEHVWIPVNEFIKDTINKERKYLEDSIENKRSEISMNLNVSKDQTNNMIRNSVVLLKKWLYFNNNYTNDLSINEFVSKEKKELLNKIINESCKIEDIKPDNSLNILFKYEELNIADLNYENCDFIKYFLRYQYISNDTCEVNFFYKEKENILYFITDLKELKPLRLFLGENRLSEEDKILIIKKIISILLIFHDKSLPLHNFGPDMIFCKRLNADVDVKIVESTHKSDEWKFVMFNNETPKVLFHKYPFYNLEKEPSMFYSLCWTIFIILNGKCENISPFKVNNISFENDMKERFIKFARNDIYCGCCKVVKMCLQRPFKLENMAEIVRIFEEIINVD